MFKFITSLFWGDNTPNNATLTLDEAYDIIQDSQERSYSETSEEEDTNLGAYEVCTKTGKITNISSEGYTIDEIYIFKSAENALEVGTRISYQLIKSDGELKVVDVNPLENDWNVVQTGKRSWYSRTLICSVTDRTGRMITLSPGDISVNLNVVASEFIPIVGDWVELDVNCEVDENVVDLNGKIIQINRLGPVRSQFQTGKITHWVPDLQRGTINNKIFFNLNSVCGGYIPRLNDQVATEIIESTQDRCTWRAVKVVPEYMYKTSKPSLTNINEDELLQSAEGLSITDNISLSFAKFGEVKLFTIEVLPEKQMLLISVEFPKVNGQCRLVSEIDHLLLKASEPLTLRFECKVKNIGDSRELAIFHFEDFKIRRWIDIHFDNYVPKTTNGKSNRTFVNAKPWSKRQVIKGEGISMPARFKTLSMPDYPLPERILNAVVLYSMENHRLRSEIERLKPSFTHTLNYMNYEDKLHGLLHLDEATTALEMHTYDQEKACFIKCNEFLLLEIDNLSERRPSLIPGDRIRARNIFNDLSPDYDGFIHKIAKNHVYIKFTQMFHDSYDGEDYAITVVAGRTTYRREHHAVHLAIRNLGKEWLFPTKVIERVPQIEFVFDSYHDSMNNSDAMKKFENKPSHNVIDKDRILNKIRQFKENNQEEVVVAKLDWYNKSLNYYQKEAVRNILLGVCRPLPYLIFGPPGTGKTVTLVESVLQILRLMPHSRILIAAPSNAAADIMALRLIDSGVVKPGDLIRLVAATAIASIPARLAPYCATANIEREGTETSQPVVATNGMVLGYSSSVIGRHRITIATCSSCALLHSMGYSKGHFTHIFVDEAGQTSEPSVLIPLAFLEMSSGQAILAGDPMQLGPVVLSLLAAEYGLGESFLERMTNRFPYLRDPDGFPDSCGYDPRLITKLVYNYRSLPELLKMPSFLFYNDDLIPTICATTSKEALLLKQLKDLLPRTSSSKLSAFVFHGVAGDNYQKEDSPSWFNPQEAAQVFYYVNELYRLGLDAQDIGIITPYKAQTKQLLELFREAEFTIPKVGTVEEFQGQEFNVIILSTVRSSKRYIEYDIKHTLGFIASPRRLNVSITRAKALLIIIGNPNLLMVDNCWRSVINHCLENGNYLGCPIVNKN